MASAQVVPVAVVDNIDIRVVCDICIGSTRGCVGQYFQ